jgi:lysophospholipase L1-like esterase
MSIVGFGFERTEYMKKTVKTLGTLVLSLLLLTALMTSGLAADTPGKLNYMAFGDSVAAGVRGGCFELRSDKGYVDDIANLLSRKSVLGNFNKDFCVSGMTAQGLALGTSVLRDSSSNAAGLVRNADVITLDIGANDILESFSAYATTFRSVKDLNYDFAKQLLNNMINELYYGSVGAEIPKSIETILENILTANGGVRIYVMGYYNPLPLFSSILEVDLNQPTEYLNTLIRNAISKIQALYPQASIVYVPTFDAMASAANTLVISDIHPTEAGHRIIAQEFWRQLEPYAGIFQVTSAVSTTVFKVGSTTIPLGAYLINDNNYIKLRDVAMVLNGTPKQIAVVWDSATDVVNITSGKPYKSDGYEFLPLPNSDVITAYLSKSSILIDGIPLKLTVYNIGNNNYLKLRELAETLDIDISWEAGTNTAMIDISKGYTPQD